MINLQSNDPFLYNTFFNLFQQKKIFALSANLEKFFFSVYLSYKGDTLECTIDNDQINWILPKSFNIIFKDIFDKISNKIISFDKFHYFPFKQIIKSKTKSLYLSEIQNLILINLLLHSKAGIKKEKLINIIWPNDKDLFVNKLDTHLTNLKNHLFNEIKLNMNFSSKFGVLKLVVN